MKKRILLFTAVAALGYVSLTSYDNGVAAGGGLNRTGSKGSGTNCSSGGCHGTGTGPTVTITVDSGSTLTPVTHYKPGMTYTIKLKGTGTTNTKFGFQFSSVSGTGSAQVQAGSVATGTGIHSTTVSTLALIEHSAPLTATSAGVFDQTLTWTAPATAVGNITLYCTINSVDGDGVLSSGDVSGNTSVVLTPTSSTTAVASLPADMTISTFPNPAINTVNLQLNNAQAGTYNVEVFSLDGKIVASQNVQVTGSSQSANINTASLAKGTYMISVEKDGSRKVIPVVKQ